MRRALTLVGTTVLALGLAAGPALAEWSTRGSGTGSVSTTTINPPTAASAAGASPTTVQVTVSTGPASGAPVEGYRIDRTSPSAATGVCFISGTTGSCTATASGTGQQTYSIVSFRGTTSLQYWQSSALAGITGTPTPSLVISSVVRDSGNKKVHFTGTGAVASTTLTVTICTVNSFPCAAGNVAGTSAATSPTVGAWTSAQDNNNLNASQTYYAQAVQGSAASAVFTFSTTNL